MWFFSLIVSLALATPDRLSSIHKDLAQAEKIYLTEGLASLIEFPKPIAEVRMGNPSILKAEISQVSPKEITLFLKKARSGPTNLIIRAEKRIYVFDIIPSQSIHQDYVKVSGAYGGPSRGGTHELKEVENLSLKNNTTKGKGVEIESVKIN